MPSQIITAALLCPAWHGAVRVCGGGSTDYGRVGGEGGEREVWLAMRKRGRRLDHVQEEMARRRVRQGALVPVAASSDVTTACLSAVPAAVSDCAGRPT